MSDVQAPVAADHPLMIAWKAYQETEGYHNSRGWALQIAPMVQHGSPDAERQRRFEIMPLDQREQHVDGALWAAFVAGFQSQHDKSEKED